VGTRALELLNRLGVEAVYEHDVALANRLAAGLGMPLSNSAIVALDGRAVQSDCDARASLLPSAVAGFVSCHLPNAVADVDAALDAIAG